jgi:protein-tyrosine-phosphatase
VHPGAVAAAERAGLDLAGARPRHINEVATAPAVVITVCDRAHEELEAPQDWLHWSVPDPVGSTTGEPFDTALADITRRIAALTSGGTDT